MLEKASERAVLVLVIFIAAGAAVFLLYAQQQSQPIEEEPDLDLGDMPTVEEGVGTVDAEHAPVIGNCPNVQGQQSRDLCWMMQGLEEEDLDACRQVEDNSRRIVCIRGIARARLDSGVCEQEFSGNETQKYICISEVAREKLDYGMCNEMPQPFDERCVWMLQFAEGILPAN